MIFGILLGIADQASAGTAGGLRLPALLAALFLVGQGLVLVLQGIRKEKAASMEKRVAEAVKAKTGGRSEVVAETESGAVVIATETQNNQTILQHAKLLPVTVPQRATSGMALMLMALAIWLGWAALTVTAPPALSGLSLLGSFLVFALGWKTLVDPDQS